jgi:hypothetical protein
MRALITASFDPSAKARLARHMDIVHEDWKERNHIYFDGAAFARRIGESAPTSSSSRRTWSIPKSSTPAGSR